MYSGKSTALFQRLEKLLYAKKKVLLIRPKKDDRGYFTHSGGIDLDKLEKNNPNFVILSFKEIDESDVKSIANDGFDVVFVDEYFMIQGAYHLCHQNEYDVYYGTVLDDKSNPSLGYIPIADTLSSAVTAREITFSVRYP